MATKARNKKRAAAPARKAAQRKPSRQAKRTKEPFNARAPKRISVLLTFDTTTAARKIARATSVTFVGKAGEIVSATLTERPRLDVVSHG